MQEQAISKGIAPGAASWLFSSMGLGNFAGRLSFGLICDAVTARTGEHNVVFVIIAGSLVNGLGGWHQLHISVVTSAANRLIGEVVQSRRRPLLLVESTYRLLVLSYLRHY